MSKSPEIVSTTVLSVRRDGRVVVASDGQVTLDKTVVKGAAKKVRRLAEGKVLCGFAGGAADALSLLGRLDEKLAAHSGQLERAAVELVRDWRTDRILRRLEAMLVVADAERTFVLSGTGDLIEPDEGIVGIGSGSVPAMGAGRALMTHTDLDARTIAVEAMKVAGAMDIYTNDSLTIEEL